MILRSRHSKSIVIAGEIAYNIYGDKAIIQEEKDTKFLTED